MQRVVTTCQMREIDRDAIGGNASVGYTYMQRAAGGLFRLVQQIAPHVLDVNIAVLCGKGNNGGDGYVLGCLLVDAGYAVTCFSAVPPELLTGECAKAHQDYRSRNGAQCFASESDSSFTLDGYTILVDALLGTGLTGDPRGTYATLIHAVNHTTATVIAVDTPSGLDLDTGIPYSPMIHADYTVAMGFAKPGHYFYPGKTAAGILTIQDLSYPEHIADRCGGATYIPEIKDLRLRLPLRKPSGSKFDHGQALIIAGSPGMTGSVTLCAEAALRSGCGMVHCAFPEPLNQILSVKLTEPILHPQAATTAGSLSKESLPGISLLMQRMQAACIGPGLTFNKETAETVRHLVRTSSIPLILDADGLNAFKSRSSDLKEHDADLIITPHCKEWERLFGALPASATDILDTVRRTSVDFRITILLKGNPTVVATPDGATFIMPFGNSALAKAGSGDVLSGMIVSLLAMGASAPDAALLGAYLHGTAGELSSKKLGEYSVTPRDVVAHIARAFATLTK